MKALGTAARPPSGAGSPPRVVCLGGGFVAVYVVRALKRAVRAGEVDLTIISRDNFHTVHGFVAEMLCGRIQPGQIISPARRLFAPARFHHAEVEGVDVDRKVVTTSRHLDGKRFDVPYDHLVLGLGARDDVERYPGLAEHALVLSSYADAVRARNHLLGMMEMAAIEPDPVERRRLLTFVVAGGNFGGVEVAAEADEHLRALTQREYPSIDADEIRVLLVHSGAHVLSELESRQPRLQRWAERHLRTRTGIELRLRRRVAAATATDVVLDDGERIPARTLISCTGMAQSPLLETLPFARDDRGRVVTDDRVRIVTADGTASDHVWAGGDCAAVPHPRGGTNPPLAIYAMATGWRIGRNILRTIRGEELEPYRFVELGDACALGNRRAVAHIRGFRMTGLAGWIGWRFALLCFVPSRGQRLRLLLDWLSTPLVGRDVAQQHADQPIAARRELFEPGQDIVTQGEIGHRLYLIASGEADVLRAAGNGHQEHLATLGPGQHFGELSVFEDTRRNATVRARTRVEVLSLGRDLATSLSTTAAGIGAHLRRGPGSPPSSHEPDQSKEEVDVP